MSGATATAIIASAAIGAATSIYTSQEQKKAQKKAAAKREEAARREKERLAKIESERRPTEEGATIEYGAEDTGDTGEGYGEFLVPTTSGASKLGTSGGSGLGAGSAGLSSLGMK